MRRRCGMVIAGLLGLAGCNGGDDPTPTTVTVSTVPAPTTPVPPTTKAPTTSAATTSLAPPTTPAPTTAQTVTEVSTTAPLDLAATIERDLNLGEQALFVIGADPSAENVQQLAAQYFAEVSLDNVLAGIETLVRDDLVLQPDPAIQNVVRLVTPPVLDPATNRATAQTCRIDATQIWGRVNDTEVRAPIATGSVKILADSVIVFADGIWKLADGTTISREEGGSTCD